MNGHQVLLALAMCAAGAIGALPARGQTTRQVQTFDTSDGLVKIIPIYHASLLIQAGGKNVYLDPAKPADLTGLPPASLILISDIHPDHMDAAAVASLSRAGTEIFAPRSVVQTIPAAKPISNGETMKWDKWTIEAIPMYNIVRKRETGEPFHTKGRGNGYVLSYGGKRFYFSGDTEGIPEMRALKNIDVAFISMYEGPTMSPEEAANAVLAFRPKVAIPYHFKTSNPAIFQKKLQGSGIEVRLLNWYPKKN